MSGMEKHKRKVEETIDGLHDKLVAISTAIHSDPELGLQEHRACELLLSEIQGFDFLVQRGVAGLETAFTAIHQGDKEGPTIAFLAEYDALPELGHACGHNIIAASAFGAAVSLKQIVDEIGGAVMLIGTPDEEAVDEKSRGGKVIMCRNGIFDNIDVALMMHPTSGPNVAWRYSFPLKDFFIRFYGKPAHYTKPHEGINALECLLLFFNCVHTLKRGWNPDVMFAYTITDGGGPSAITVPQTAEAHITLKAFYSEYLEELYKIIGKCAKGIEMMSGAQSQFEVLGEYKNMIPNLNLILSLYKNMQSLHQEVENPLLSQRHLERSAYPGISTDFGDVSWLLPAIHGYCSIGDSSLVAHTPEFAAAAGSQAGQEAVLFAAKSMAMTATELLTDRSFTDRVHGEYERYKHHGFRNIPGLPPSFHEFPKEFLKHLESI